MDKSIKVEEILSKTERVSRDGITANVVTEGSAVRNIENGSVTADGNSVATFSAWGDSLSVSFSGGCDNAAILAQISTFIDLLKN